MPVPDMQLLNNQSADPSYAVDPSDRIFIISC